MSKKLFVGNLSYGTTEESLQDFFGQAGAVESVRVVTDRDTGQSRGFGFVEMVNDEDAEKAVASLDGQSLDGRQIVVNEARPKAPREGGGGGDYAGGGGYGGGGGGYGGGGGGGGYGGGGGGGGYGGGGGRGRR